MLWLFVGHIGVYLLDFFCSGIQFYLLLSPYLCFISLLYLDLYVLGGIVLISLGSFMQTKYLCVLIYTKLRVRLARRETCLSPPVKYFTDRSKAVLLLWIYFLFFSVLCLLCLCARLFICALWSPAGKGLTSWLSFVVSNCEFVTFPLVSWVRCGT